MNRLQMSAILDTLLIYKISDYVRSVLVERKGMPEIANFVIRLRKRQSAWNDAHGANRIPERSG